MRASRFSDRNSYADLRWEDTAIRRLSRAGARGSVIELAAASLPDARRRRQVRVRPTPKNHGGSSVLGLMLGTIGFALTSLVYEPEVGLVIGLTLLAVCTVAATIGGIMPLVARAIHVDPAVFSNPFITTFVDATGLIIYFLIARAVLGL